MSKYRQRDGNAMRPYDEIVNMCIYLNRGHISDPARSIVDKVWPHGGEIVHLPRHVYLDQYVRPHSPHTVNQ